MQRAVSYYSQHNRKMIVVKLIQADKKWQTLLSLVNAGGITLPGRRVIIDAYYWHDAALIRHELCHVEQYERLGTVRFLWRYITLWMRYGYERHPMEIEARKHEVSSDG